MKAKQAFSRFEPKFRAKIKTYKEKTRYLVLLNPIFGLTERNVLKRGQSGFFKSWQRPSRVGKAQSKDCS